MIQKQQLDASYYRIRPFIHQTAVLQSNFINQKFGAEVFFKCENFQKTGSFKARGATNAIVQLVDKQKGVVTHSSGNHGQALAWAAKQQNIPCWVVMPSNAPQVKKDAVKNYGAQIVFCEPTLKAREAEMLKVQGQTGAIFIPPYNHHHIIEGQASAAIEVYQQHQDLDYILAPVGGGGLLSGTALATQYYSSKTKVIGCEPQQADDAYQSFYNKELIPSVNPNTMADGLRTSLGEITFGYIQKGVSDILLCSEGHIIEAMQMLWQRLKIVVEPSSCVPLACMLAQPSLYQGKRLAIIISGGNVDLSALPF